MTKTSAAVATSPAELASSAAASSRARRGDLISPVVLRGTLRAAEYGVITFIGFVVAALYVGDHEDVLSAHYLATLALTGLVAVSIFQLMGLMRRGCSPRSRARCR